MGPGAQTERPGAAGRCWAGEGVAWGQNLTGSTGPRLLTSEAGVFPDRSADFFAKDCEKCTRIGFAASREEVCSTRACSAGSHVSLLTHRWHASGTLFQMLERRQ